MLQKVREGHAEGIVLACHLFGNPLNSKEFWTKLLSLSPTHGMWEQSDSIKHALRNGEEFYGKQQIDPVRPTLTMILDFLTELYEQGQ